MALTSKAGSYSGGGEWCRKAWDDKCSGSRSLGVQALGEQRRFLHRPQARAHNVGWPLFS